MPQRTIKAAVFDIDGTLALMDKSTGTYTALPGAVEALARCRRAGIKVVAYTNGTFFPPAHYYPLLADAGLEFEPDHILTPAEVAAKAMAEMGYKKVMVFGADGTTVPMQDAGIEVVAPTKDAGPVEAVLLGWTRDLSAEALEATVQAVWDGAKPFAGSVAPYFAAGKGRMLGISGAIAAALENATDEKVTVFGKPEVAGLDIVTSLTGVQPEEMVVIGDDPSLEIAMGRKAGSLTLGVTTGVRDRAAFLAMDEVIRVHDVIESLTEIGGQAWLKERV